ncbi:hypothetical protein BV25DRAFT_1835394 [Artomyces pyxidatus]|uniref:Uncharacterized protein n=1 Tax=Artomyces pyxidatus TaxID=48021 RepID=A0ACB8TF92_9AGAM|nr:hypothetical protein BV25DRAFT_1835394 [Artomyces pyxidatus]
MSMFVTRIFLLHGMNLTMMKVQSIDESLTPTHTVEAAKPKPPLQCEAPQSQPQSNTNGNILTLPALRIEPVDLSATSPSATRSQSHLQISAVSQSSLSYRQIEGDRPSLFSPSGNGMPASASATSVPIVKLKPSWLGADDTLGSPSTSLSPPSSSSAPSLPLPSSSSPPLTSPGLTISEREARTKTLEARERALLVRVKDLETRCALAENRATALQTNMDNLRAEERGAYGRLLTMLRIVDNSTQEPPARISAMLMILEEEMVRNRTRLEEEASARQIAELALQKEREQHQHVLQDIHSECRGPFVVPALLDAFLALSSMSDRVLQ